MAVVRPLGTILLAVAVLATGAWAGCLMQQEYCPHFSNELYWHQAGLYAAMPESDVNGFNVTLRLARGEVFTHPLHGDVLLSAVRWYRTPGEWGSPIEMKLNRTGEGIDRIEVTVVATTSDEPVAHVFRSFMTAISASPPATVDAWTDAFIANRTPAGFHHDPSPQAAPAPSTLAAQTLPARAEEAVDRLHVNVTGPYRFEDHWREAHPSEAFVKPRAGMTRWTGGQSAQSDTTARWAYEYETSYKRAERWSEGNGTGRMREYVLVDDRDHATYGLNRADRIQDESEHTAHLHAAIQALGLPPPPPEGHPGSPASMRCLPDRTLTPAWP